MAWLGHNRGMAEVFRQKYSIFLDMDCTVKSFAIIQSLSYQTYIQNVRKQVNIKYHVILSTLSSGF